MCEIRRAARRHTFAECWLVKGHSVGVEGCCDDDVDGRSGVVEVEGVAYSETCSMVLLLLQEQRMFVIWVGSSGGVHVAGAVLLAFAAAAVRSQCFLMNMGMSWKARKRCVLTCALEWV